MPELRNSIRASYKATYNQISPTGIAAQNAQPNIKATPKRGAGPYRAIEKAAFIQSLRISPSELASFKDRESDAGRPGVDPKLLGDAVQAISRLLSDQSSVSTIKNAAPLASVDPVILAFIATDVVTQRQRTRDSIERLVGDILSAYRTALSQGAVIPIAQGTVPGAVGSVDPRAPSTQLTNSSGARIRKSVQPVASSSDDAKTASRGTRYSIYLDTQADSSGKGSSTSPLSRALSRVRGDDALAWAEKAKLPEFTTLLQQLQPYSELRANEVAAFGNAVAAHRFLTTQLASLFNIAGLHTQVDQFVSRMSIEPIGWLHLERLEMYPAGIERGELVHSVPLAPGETVNISHKEWSVSEKEFEDIVQDQFEGYSEQGVAEKSDISMSNDSQSQHTTAMNIGASLSASYSSVTLSTSFGYNTTSNDSQSKKDSRNHSMSITKKASARTKKDHKVTFKVTSVAGSEDQSVRVISNPSATDAMRIDYYQLAKKWKIDLLRYGLRMTYDLVIPNPGSGLVTMVQEVQSLSDLINTPFVFDVQLTDIQYVITGSGLVSNYDLLATLHNASVSAPPTPFKYVNFHKEPERVDDYSNVHFDSLDFETDENYFIAANSSEINYSFNKGDDAKSFFLMIGGEGIDVGLGNLVGLSGHLSIDTMYQYIWNYAINVTLTCQIKDQAVADWKLQVWNQLRQAAEDQYNKDLQTYRDRQAELLQKIQDFDALTLRRMEQEEIMKGVLRWLLGPSFSLVPSDLSLLFGNDGSDPGVTDVLDPNALSQSQWYDVMQHGEFIKFIHNAIEWENVLYFTYPYFWDDNKLWDFKKFLSHPDATHRMFLRAGAARVVLTVRPGFEKTFTQVVQGASFASLPSTDPYVTIAQEIQDFANTNYPGFPPANPEENARPLLYLEQRLVWAEMQYIIQLLNACKAATGAFPSDNGTGTIPAAALTPYLDGPIVIDTVAYNGINDYNSQANHQQLALDPNTPAEALLLTYNAVPIQDKVWKNPYVYRSPGITGDFDLICYGADGKEGGTDKDADISANCEASLISTWYEYTPINGLDIGVTMNKPNVMPAPLDSGMA